MKTKSVEMGKVLVELDRNDLLILNNALNEVCNGLDLAEFSLRIGAEREEVQNLLTLVGGMYNQVAG